MARSVQVTPTQDFAPWRSGILPASGWEPPDIIEFTVSDKYLDRPYLFPRQATILKLIFLQTELFTQYDYDVIGQWAEDFEHTGLHGVSPDIFERIEICRSQGRRWFHEVVSAIGRRGSKGHIGGISGSYVLWTYMGKGDPQGFYGIDRDKQLACFVYAAKKEQAIVNQWGDLVNMITGGPCFAPWISKSLGHSLSVFAPNDMERLANLQRRGIESDRDIATFLIQPKESTLTSGRGPAAFLQMYDEMAHVVATGTTRDIGDVYNCLDPATRVLRADLTWDPIEKLAVGDEVVAIDEVAEKGKQRKLRKAVVKDVRETFGPAIRLGFEDGTSVVCSPNHRWFVANGDGMHDGRWTRTDNLMLGSGIRVLVDQPWEVIDTRDAGWLAGMFDGEGCVPTTLKRGTASQVSIAQNPGLILDRVLLLLRQYGFEPKSYRRESLCEQWYVTGLSECMRLLGSLRPERLLTKQEQLWNGRSLRSSKKAKRITSMMYLPDQRLIDIETTTGTFIAEGLVSHNSAKPALDQFGKDGFIYEPSSTWTMTGKFFQNAQDAIEREDSAPVYPDMVLIQLESWDPYLDWEHARSMTARPQYQIERPSASRSIQIVEKPEILFKRLAGPISVYDHEMELEERKNPESFAVERRSHWATVLDAYLDPEKVKAMWEPWPDENRPLEMQTRGVLAISYKAHGDPAKSGANFGFAVGHTEPSMILRTLPGYEEPQPVPVNHVVFDVITAWRPEDYDNHELPYLDIEDDIFEKYVVPFQPEEVTFDQFNSPGIIQSLSRRARADQRIKKHINVFEKTATRPLNWRKAETFKSALNLGFVHGPYFELADLELRFLQEVNGAVDHPTSGPVQTKDVSDCLFEVVHALLGDQMATFVGSDLASLGVHGALPGGTGETYRDEATQQLAQSMRRPNGRSYQQSPSRGGRLVSDRGGYRPVRGRPF